MPAAGALIEGLRCVIVYSLLYKAAYMQYGYECLHRPDTCTCAYAGTDLLDKHVYRYMNSFRKHVQRYTCMDAYS